MKTTPESIASQLSALIREGNINGYSDYNQLRKDKFHLLSKSLLTMIAKDLGYATGYTIYSNRGGSAVAGEVSLTVPEIKIVIHGFTYEDYNITFLSNLAPKVWAFYELHTMKFGELQDYQVALDRFREVIHPGGTNG